MKDKEYHSFYEDAVNASAAYLENEDGMILARCIIYNEVKDRSRKLWKLAERQYSCNDSEVLKRALVDALIRGGHIDGYKKVGAGSGDARCFVDTDGNSLLNLEFSISCNLDYGDTLSYQDSFKWYDMDSKEANNYECGDITLDLTDGTARRDELYEMMSDMRSGQFGVLQGQENISFGKEANGSTMDAFSPFMDKCHNSSPSSFLVRPVPRTMRLTKARQRCTNGWRSIATRRISCCLCTSSIRRLFRVW